MRLSILWLLLLVAATAAGIRIDTATGTVEAAASDGADSVDDVSHAAASAMGFSSSLLQPLTDATGAGAQHTGAGTSGTGHDRRRTRSRRQRRGRQRGGGGGSIGQPRIISGALKLSDPDDGEEGCHANASVSSADALAHAWVSRADACWRSIQDRTCDHTDSGTVVVKLHA